MPKNGAHRKALFNDLPVLTYGTFLEPATYRGWGSTEKLVCPGGQEADAVGACRLIE